MTEQSVREAVRVALAAPPAAGRLGTGGRVWVGFSGGLDSSVLLDAAAAVGAPGLRVVHINHQLHADSASWAAHCRSVCAGYGVECHSRNVQVDPSGNLEQGARDARFEVFRSVLNEGDRLLLGHHADDQAETILFRLLRGSGARPGGMSDRRALGRGWLLRPLLGLSRATLTDYANGRNLAWLDDPSNADTSFDRNFLRQRVLPRLRERWPETATTLSGAARNQARDAALLDHLLDSHIENLQRDGALFWPDVESFPQPERLVRHWLERAGFHGTRARALDEFCRQLRDGAAAPLLRLDDHSSLRAFNDLLYVVHDRPPPPTFEHGLELREGTHLSAACFAHGRLEASRTEPGVTSGRARLKAGDYRVRPRRGGERLRLRVDQSRPVKQLLAEARVPPWRRADYPLIWSGAELVAVPGIGVAHGYRDDAGWVLDWQPADVLKGPN